MEISSGADNEDIKKGQELKQFFETLKPAAKTSFVWYRINHGSIPDGDDLDDDIEFAKLETTLRNLANVGICYISEDDFEDIINELGDTERELLDNHVAWDYLTRLEIIDHIEGDDFWMEAWISEGTESIHDIGIDLVIDNDSIQLTTCKFNLNTQTQEACSRLSGLSEIKPQIEVNSQIALGTLTLKEDRSIIYDLEKELESLNIDIDDVDIILSGFDMLPIK
jgi:hypothetical protein